MSSALARASTLKADIRLAQAVSEFEAVLSNEQKSTLRTLRSQSLSATPSPSDVMRLTAEVDRRISNKFGGQCFGPRFTNFLQGVQQFAALGDVVVGGSQNLVACGVWSLVRMSLLSIVSMSTYLDKLSSLFMDIGRSAPRNQAMALLYPRSTKLQTYLSEYFIVVVGLCRHLLKVGRKSTIQQFTSTLNDSNLNTFRSELDEWANLIRDEMHLNEAQENSGFRALSRKMFKSASYQQRLATNLRVLDFCSTYNHQTTWKQIRKAGNTSFFMQRAEYQEWRNSFNPCTLMYTGKLGSGKSVLLANIVDDLNVFTEKHRFVVAYFYCKHDVPESLKAQTILGSLARQLLCTVPDLAVLLESCEDPRSTGDIKEVLKLLVRGFSPSHKAYFVLDGLDECNYEEKEILVQAFQEIQMTLKILICVSFRVEPNNGLQWITERLVATRVVSMPDNNPDIKAFIEADLECHLRHKRLILGDPFLILSIQDALLEGSQGMFLWVALQIQSLCGMKTDKAIREALADLPKDLSETFSRILRKSGSSDQPLQVKTLQLVLAASRPLTTGELREALSVTPGDATWDSSKVLNDVESALNCCGCLLIVDEEESTVRIVHHSAKQYILDRSNRVNNVSFSAEEAQRTMANIVVTYLGYGVFGTELSRTKVHPVMAQSAPSKVMVATMGSSSTIGNIAIKLLKSRKQPDFDIGKTLAEARKTFQSGSVEKFRFYSYANKYWLDHIFYVSGRDMTMLNLSIKLAKSPIIEADMAAKDYMMHWNWAAENGNETILELLLKTGKVSADWKDRHGRTPLSWVAENGHETVVRLLLDRDDVEADSKDNIYCWTPLLWAARYGHKAVVELLVNRNDVKADYRDINRRTPLSWAAENGYEAVVELLVDRDDVEADFKDNTGRTPLSWAAGNGHKAVVGLLVDRDDVEVDSEGINGWTPISWAIGNGHVAVVRLLQHRARKAASPSTEATVMPQ